MLRLFTKIISFFIALHFHPTHIWASPQAQLFPSCEQNTHEALGRINKVPMEKRAAPAWKELSQTEIHCNHPDRDLMTMAQKASKYTGVKREWELGQSMRQSSHLEKICSSAIWALDKAMVLAPKDQIDFLVKNCPIKDPVGHGARRDLSLMTFLYVQALWNHWKNHGVTDSSHQIILNTLLLASAQEWGIIDDLIDQLSQPAPLARNREDIEQEIKKQGLDAIPVLINRLDDQTPAGETAGSPPGHCINLPPLEAEDLPDECQNLKTGGQTMTIGQRCENILYALITPPVNPALDKGRILWKSRIDRTFVVNHWSVWWGKNQEKSIEELRARARELDNQFWKRGWDKGPMEWN